MWKRITRTITTIRRKIKQHYKKVFGWYLNRPSYVVKQLLKQVPKKEQAPYKIVLDNTVNYLHNVRDGYPAGSMPSGNRFDALVLKTTKRIFDGLFARQIVGVQPMSGPVGTLYTLRYRQKPIEGVEDGKQLTLEVMTQAVEAVTQRLQTQWTIEAMQDLKELHDIDFEEELMQVIAAEIIGELDAQLVADLLHLAGIRRTVDLSLPLAKEQYPYVGDVFARVGITINQVAGEIATKTRRGSGNFIVCSPMIISILQSSSKSVFAPAVQGSFKGPNNTMLVGVLNGTIKVYSSLDLHTGDGVDKILVGYKGTGEVDAGYFFNPYILLMSSGIVINPYTFQPCVSLMTRNGRAILEKTSQDCLGNSPNYYGVITVTGLDFGANKA